MHCSQVNFKWKWNRCDCLKMWSNYLIYELNQCCLFDCEKERKTAFDFNLFCFFLHFKFIWLGCSTENVVCCSVNFEWFIFTWKENWKYILYFVCLHNLVRWTEFEPLRNVYASFKKTSFMFRDVWEFERIFVEWLLFV